MDAARNRELVLAAAQEEFAERGLDASIADIARRAGVAKGTVFRHFATKEELIVAVVGNRFIALTDAARRLSGSDDPGGALLEFLTLAAEALHEHDLSVIQTLADGDPTVLELRDRLLECIEPLVERARTAGAVRPELTGTDVFVLLCAPVHAVGSLPTPAPEAWRRYLALIFDGFRPGSPSPLPDLAPGWPVVTR